MSIEEKPTRSARTWIIGEGHVPLEEARKWALDQVAKAEAELMAAEEAEGVSQTALRVALRNKEQAHDRTERAREKHAGALEDLQYRAGRGDR